MFRMTSSGYVPRLVLIFASVFVNAAQAGPYDLPAKRASDWLIANMASSDGSWGGAGDELIYLQTSEAVLALGALNRRSFEYNAGITWLENHPPANVDYNARRVLALQANGNNVSADIAALLTAQNVTAPGNSGWGLSKAYQGSPIDTALTLQAYKLVGVNTNVASALAYLKSCQLTGADKGWPIAQEATSDPVTTAQVLLALIAYRSGDATLATPIANGMAALASKVTTGSPVHWKALAALTYLRDNPASSQAVTLLSNLITTQGIDGSWGGDVHATALAARAFAAAMGRDRSADLQAVVMLDSKLRAAINQALNRNALDALNRGEIAQLTSLNIAGQGISDLTGLEFATNLTQLDARNNNIASFAPVEGLTGLNILRDGNPGIPGADEYGDAPTLPEWAAILLGCWLLYLAQGRPIRMVHVRQRLGQLWRDRR
ncbi:MAG TPA: hypothetical protein VGM84_19630 [Steroidobacteraceae bacterium]|jgi:hypothetical protein